MYCSPRCAITSVVPISLVCTVNIHIIHSSNHGWMWKRYWHTQLTLAWKECRILKNRWFSGPLMAQSWRQRARAHVRQKEKSFVQTTAQKVSIWHHCNWISLFSKWNKSIKFLSCLYTFPNFHFLFGNFWRSSSVCGMPNQIRRSLISSHIADVRAD